MSSHCRSRLHGHVRASLKKLLFLRLQAKNEWGGTVYPCLPGHEMVGIVTEVGAEVTQFKVPPPPFPPPRARAGTSPLLSVRFCEAFNTGEGTSTTLL